MNKRKLNVIDLTGEIEREKKEVTRKALLEECLVNGKKGPEALYAWFQGERRIIEDAVQDYMNAGGDDV